MDQETKDQFDTVKMKLFAAVMQIKDLKAGDTITEDQFKAIEFLVGPGLLEKARSMKPTVATVNFTKDGQPYTTDGNPLGITIDGKKPLDLTEERKDVEQ